MSGSADSVSPQAQLTAPIPADAVAPVQQVMAIPEDDVPYVDKESLRKCGPLPFGSAAAYARAIPPERRSVTGCYKIKCPGGCCIGYSYNVDCKCCLWTPSCPLLSCLHFFFSDDDGGWFKPGTKKPKSAFLYEVDSDTHTLALYSAGCGDWMSASGPGTPCLYCVK